MIEKKLSYTMFNHIAKTYDRINRILSLGIDVLWRNQVIKNIRLDKDFSILDLATGTGDQIFQIYKKKPFEKGIGIDMSDQMLLQAKRKNKTHAFPIDFLIQDAMKLDLGRDIFDVATMSFGIRNVESPQKCLEEIFKALKNDGQCLILEFSKPANFFFRKIYYFYLRNILPILGNLLSKHAYAYTYLNKTIETFPCGEEFLEMMKNAGFKCTQAIPLSFGIASIYIGYKVEN